MAFTSLPMHLFRRTSMTFCCLQRTLQTLPQSGSNVNRFTERSHTCGELTQKDVGQRVELCGWVKHTRYNNKIIALHDSYGTIQCVVTFEKLLKSLRRTTIHNESVIKVSGVVQSRPPNQVNAQMHSGAVEVLIDDLKVISGASKDLPILTRENIHDYTLINKLKYRYLDIRSKPMQEALRFRSKVSSILRQQLLELDFVECETPTLFRRTPGGANEFIVPTQMSNLFYGLTQSPQQLKQLLMIGGLDRYFQICRCYRDESGRTDRQPEFTQLDIEMSFTNQDMIIELVNWIIFRLLKNLKEKADFYVDLSAIFDADQQIRRMSYLEALMNYGCDKPDTRFGWLIRESESEKGLCIVVPFIVEDDLLVESLKTIQADKNVDVFKHVVKTELDFDKASTKIFINEQSDQARQILGQLRLLIANKLDSLGHKVYENNFRFIWITNFPLFEYNEKTHAFQSSHHPFTAPTEDTKHLLDTDPSQVIGNHYDLVLNGQEIGGGSIRIHDANLQRMIFSDILKLDDNTFEYFIEALHAGCPPHGGIALGLDRLVAILLNRDSIRDVIAFPKSNLGRDIMSGCPHEIDQDVKKMYHLGI